MRGLTFCILTKLHALLIAKLNYGLEQQQALPHFRGTPKTQAPAVECQFNCSVAFVLHRTSKLSITKLLLGTKAGAGGFSSKESNFEAPQCQTER